MWCSVSPAAPTMNRVCQSGNQFHKDALNRGALIVIILGNFWETKGKVRFRHGKERHGSRLRYEAGESAVERLNCQSGLPDHLYFVALRTKLFDQAAEVFYQLLYVCGNFTHAGDINCVRRFNLVCL